MADKPELLSKILLQKNKDEGFSISSCLHESDVRVIYKILKDHPEEYKKVFIDDGSHKACLLSDDIIGIINGEPNAKELLNESYIKHMISGDIHPRWTVKILSDIEKYFRNCEP